MERSPERLGTGDQDGREPEGGTRKGKQRKAVIPQPGVSSLAAAAPPAVVMHDLPPDRIEFYVRAGIHSDRTPGNLLVIRHPAKAYKLPRPLLGALEGAGFSITRVNTDADRVRSVERIRDALLGLARERRPLDLLVVSGDGTLDHHVLVAAFWAFFPDLVRFREGAIDCSGVDERDLAGLPASYRAGFFGEIPNGSVLDPSESTVKEIWLLRSRITGRVRKAKPVRSVARRAGRTPDDPLLRIAVLAALLPDKVVLRSHGFDLSGLANAPQERTFKGLYPYIRCIANYPAGTAADNAVFAGVPGTGYGMFARLLSRTRLFSPLRKLLERRVTRAFLRYFLSESVVVPARISLVGFDNEWQRVSSHAAGGPAAGLFFSADLTSKTNTLRGYLKRIPQVVIREGLFGSTIVRVRSRYASGAEKTAIEARISEALYTNRTFIAGVGSVPTTNPTSFAGQSSLCVLPPIWSWGRGRRPVVNLRGVGVFVEGIAKGVAARLLHMAHLGVGTLAGGGRFSFLLPEHQVAIKEGETIEIDYLNPDRSSRAVAIQVSGDPFQAWRMWIRMAWGPVPLLGRHRSLLVAATRRSLADLRLQQSYRLGRIYIGGLRFFWHHVGEDWNPEFGARTGLLRPPSHLPRNLVQAQRSLLDAWHLAGAGDFVDTTESGMAIWRRGRYAHNHDQSAHLLLLREPQGQLLVRQVRAIEDGTGGVYEARTWYRAVGGSYILFRGQTVLWEQDGAPRLLQEDHFFRSAEAFQQEAPTFFPVVARTPDEPTLLSRESDPAEEEPGEAAEALRVDQETPGGTDPRTPGG